MLYHESDLKIREHCTDTAGFTDHVFALMHLLGCVFCRESGISTYKRESRLIPGASVTDINLEEIEIHWREVLRLATSIKQGTVYIKRVIDALKRKGLKFNEQLLSHLSPSGWEHINLTGD